MLTSRRIVARCQTPLSNLQHTCTRAAGCCQAPLVRWDTPSIMKLKCALLLGEKGGWCTFRHAACQCLLAVVDSACGMQHGVCCRPEALLLGTKPLCSACSTTVFMLLGVHKHLTCLVLYQTAWSSSVHCSWGKGGWCAFWRAACHSLDALADSACMMQHDVCGCPTTLLPGTKPHYPQLAAHLTHAAGCCQAPRATIDDTPAA